MKARAYFLVLRPWRSFLILLFYGYFIWSWTRHLLHLPPPRDRLVAFLLIEPYVLGVLLLSPLREVMHRSFSPLLPGLESGFRVFHAWACALGAMVVVTLTAFLVPAYPLLASFGFAAAGLALPLWDVSHWYTQAQRYRVLGILGGLGLLLYLDGEPLLSFGEKYPWGVAGLGLAFAYLCFRRAFTRGQLRERCSVPQFALQSTILLNRALLHESRHQLQRLALAQTSEGDERCWRVRPCDGTLSAWIRLQMYRHFRTPKQALVQLLVITLFPAVTLLLMLYFTSSVQPHTQERGLQELLRHGLLGAKGSLSQQDLVAASGLFYAYTGMAALYCLIQALTLPFCSFPVSRQRLAAIHYSYALGLLAVSAFCALLGLFAFIGLGSLWLQVSPAWSSFLRPTSVFLSLHSLLPVLLALALVRRFWLRLSALGLLLSLGLLLAGGVGEWAYPCWPAPYLGLLLAGLLGLSTWLGWRGYRRYFQTADLGSLGTALWFTSQLR